MPSIVDPDRFQAEIARRILQERHSQEDVIRFLQGEGIVISRNTLKTRLKQWVITRRNLALDPDTTEATSNLFHTTTMTDHQITARLNKDGISISARGVKEARLAKDWRRRNNNPEQQEEQREATRQTIAGSLSEGTTRNCGHDHLMTALRIHHNHRARQLDVKAEPRLQDSMGSRPRRPGPSQRKRRNEFITLGPDHLMAIDGHDKLRRWGIEIYTAIDAYARWIQ
jgi:hypothetical protein